MTISDSAQGGAGLDVRRGMDRLQRYLDDQVRRPLTERRTAERLRELGPEWVTFEELRWPRRGFASADHIAVGPGGVFVIDVRHWTGRTTLRGGALRENGQSREEHVAGAAEAAPAVAELTGAYGGHVRSVLCLSEQTHIRGVSEGVLLCSIDTMVELLLSRPAVLTASEVLEAAGLLEEQLWAPKPL